MKTNIDHNFYKFCCELGAQQWNKTNRDIWSEGRIFKLIDRAGLYFDENDTRRTQREKFQEKNP